MQYNDHNGERIEITHLHVWANEQVLQHHHHHWSGTSRCQDPKGATWINPPNLEIGSTPTPWVMAA
jgi:hypothetical protein